MKDFRQRNLFGDQLKKEGMEKVKSHTPEEYAKKFLETIYRFAHSMEYTVDDVIEVVGLPPNDHNAVGMLMKEAVAAGLSVFTGKYVKSQRPERHSGEIRVWRRT